MKLSGAGRWLRGRVDRKFREIADRQTTRTITALGVQARFRCVTAHELGRLQSFGGEPVILEALRRLKPGECFYDIGANIGFYSILAGMLVGPRGAVVSFEPETGNLARLQSNAVLNRLGNVIVCPLAVSDQLGTSRFHVHSAMVGDGAHAILAGSGGDLTVFRAPLDMMLETFGLPSPHHIKVDVEGHEEHVLSGMPRVLASTTLRTVILEAHYYQQFDTDRRYDDDSALNAKRSRIIDILRSNGLDLTAEQQTTEGNARFAHMVFVRA